MCFSLFQPSTKTAETFRIQAAETEQGQIRLLSLHPVRNGNSIAH
jgi:hypothetical protein